MSATLHFVVRRGGRGVGFVRRDAAALVRAMHSVGPLVVGSTGVGWSKGR